MKHISRFLTIILVVGLMAGCKHNHMVQARKYLRADEYEKAIRCLEDEINSRPDNAAAHVLLAKCFNYLDMNKREEAEYATLTRIGISGIPAIMDNSDEKYLYVFRRRLVETAAEMGPKAVDVVLVYLRDKRGMVRRTAIDILSRIDSDRVIEPAINALKDSDDGVRIMAASICGERKAVDAIKPLLRLLKNGTEFPRRAAAEALGNIGQKDPVIIRALEEALKDEKHSVKMTAAEALEKLTGKKYKYYEREKNR